MTYFKAVRPDGTDFHTGTVRWAPEQGEIPEGGIVVTHPTSTEWGESHSTHLCASVTPTDCTGFKWPCRLLEVEPVDEVHHHVRSKWSSLSWRVVRELSATDALGPQGEAVAALLDELRRLDAAGVAAWDDAWRAAAWDDEKLYSWDANRAASSWDSTRLAARVAARDFVWDIAGDAALDGTLDGAWDVAVALVMWDILTPYQRDILTKPIRIALPELWAEVSSYLPGI